jgi:hypothetical protein
MLPIKHGKNPLGKGWEAHPIAFSMQHLGRDPLSKQDFHDLVGADRDAKFTGNTLVSFK